MHCSFQLFALQERLGVGAVNSRHLLATRPHLLAQPVCTKLATLLSEETHGCQANGPGSCGAGGPAEMGWRLQRVVQRAPQGVTRCESPRRAAAGRERGKVPRLEVAQHSYTQLFREGETGPLHGEATLPESCAWRVPEHTRAVGRAACMCRPRTCHLEAGGRADVMRRCAAGQNDVIQNAVLGAAADCTGRR